jgi:hypothetical protein
VAYLNIRWNPARILPILTVLALSPAAHAAILWKDGFPGAAGNTGHDAAPVYGSLCDENLGSCPGAPSEPYILGDQFALTNSSNTITSITIFEVGNVVTTASGIPGDTPNTEFSNISLFVGPDGSATGLGPAVASLGGTALLAASVQECYTASGACGSGGNFQSINSPSNYYAMYAITFSGLNLTFGPGLYDFAIGATPIGSNTFALLTSDPEQNPSAENSSTLCGTSGCGYIYYFADGSGGSPKETYQYTPGDISGYSNGADANVIIAGTSTPEPSSFGLLGIGLAGIWAGLRRRARHHRI